MYKTLALVVAALIVLGAGAYWLTLPQAPGSETVTTNPATVTSGENPQPGSSVHDLPVEPAAAAARKVLAAKLAVEEKSIVIMQIDEKEWSDGCLGLGEANESCIQALVPGFRVEMLAQGKTYFYRTDKTGATVRSETE